MNLTPLDIQNKEFKKSLRGYNEVEVEDFLDDVLRDYEFLYKQNMELNDKISKLNDKIEEYKNLEETMRKTLLMAQETSEQLKNNSQREAGILLEEARQKSRKMIEEAEWKLEKLTGKYSDVRREMTVYCSKMKTMLATQLDIVDSQSKESFTAETPNLDISENDKVVSVADEKEMGAQTNLDLIIANPDMIVKGAMTLD